MSPTLRSERNQQKHTICVISLFILLCPRERPPRIKTTLRGSTSREVSKPRDSGLNISHRSEIWQALRQHRCQDAC